MRWVSRCQNSLVLQEHQWLLHVVDYPHFILHMARPLGRGQSAQWLDKDVSISKEIGFFKKKAQMLLIHAHHVQYVPVKQKKKTRKGSSSSVSLTTHPVPGVSSGFDTSID